LAFTAPLKDQTGTVTAGSYSVYSLNENSQVETAYYSQNEGSSPWQFNLSDNPGYKSLAQGNIIYTPWFEDDYFEGKLHNAVTVNLGFLFDDIDNFVAHFTMECGNDNLMGSTAPVPEPDTLLLFGTGLIGLAGIGRKRFKK
jgi:hypothetical protein